MNLRHLIAKMEQLDQPVVEEPNEGNEFSGALAAAKASGQKEFEVDGKKYQVKEDGSVEECGMMGDMMPPPPAKQMDNVNMNVSMNASGAGGIRDLLNVLKDIQDGPEDSMDSEPVSIKNIDAMGALIDDDFANEPDEAYGSVGMMTGRGNDIHSNIGDHRPRQAGLPMGNPMTLEARLQNLYQEIKLREGSGSKEKAHSKYVDRNSPESKAKVQAAKDKAASAKKAEPGKKLLSKINNK